ncbi:unnamed protein product [Cylindrotheca closterium]|uniref:Exoribonuclease phosphorolytic domain-containing protein n=1 Tax=Cylindrotheca closterium TaxID=2856 RepID=A0AAD2G9I0_9STRA|nr:unnamed protein product [Cylindrotheca closterium]
MSTKRRDGRSHGALRQLTCELSSLQRADGSALWKCGSTHVLGAVYGPIAPLNMAKEQEESIVTVLIKSGKSEEVTDEHKTFLTKILTNCIDVAKYPRTVVQVVLQIIQSDGSLVSCLLHAAVAALMDAGVELLYLPVATTCLVFGSNSSNSIWLDPMAAEEEEDNDNAIVTLVNNSRQPNKVLGSHTIGTSGISLNQFLACQQVATKACPAIPAFWRLAIEQKVQRESQTLWAN